MERYASLLSFDRQFSAHNSCMTELEQWKVVLPNFHMHAQITILSEFFGLFRQSFAKRKMIALISIKFSFHMTPHA